MSDLTKAADDVIDQLQKALDGGERISKAVKKADEEMPEEAEEEVEEAEDEEPEDMDEEPVAKSIYEEISEEHADYLDVSPLLDQVVKSMDGLGRSQSKNDTLLKAVASATLTNSKILKSLLDEPAVRKSVLSKQERFGGSDGKAAPQSRKGVMAKLTKAMRDGQLTMRDISIAEDRLNKGMALPEETEVILKSM